MCCLATLTQEIQISSFTVAGSVSVQFQFSSGFSFSFSSASVSVLVSVQCQCQSISVSVSVSVSVQSLASARGVWSICSPLPQKARVATILKNEGGLRSICDSVILIATCASACDTGSHILDSGSRILGPGSQIQDLDPARIMDPRSRNLDPK